MGRSIHCKNSVQAKCMVLIDDGDVVIAITRLLEEKT